MKKILSLILAVAMMASVLAGCGSAGNENAAGNNAAADTPVSDTTANETTPPADDTTTEAPSEPAEIVLPKLMVMSGPTGVGAAKLMSDNEDPAGEGRVIESASVVADNQAVMNALINGDTDIAAVATNMAATLVNKTYGALQVLAINTLGVLYILEKGDSVQSMADLEGKTVYATGQGANPEYVLNYLLTESGVAPADVDIQWMTAQEVTAKMTTEEAAICMLPVPAATAAMMKDTGIRQAVSLSEVWDSLGKGALAQGCIVARTEYIEENPQAVENFLVAYESSITYMKDEANRADASALVAQYEITANDKIAANAMDQCNLTFVTGQEMKDILVQFYDVLFQANPAAVGGAMPADTFYYGVQ